ncbi:MAG: macro domain-containing protein [Gracilibacteraceae bacterium]|jgi:O-acetyl-ADP-ribose deacetylase (regulator of RNase III)|nr:macro domain-containing protein [Gracilibacteraceae bacterium]
MLRFVTGNLFDSKAEAVVNTINCVGVMGRGIALQFKKQYPDNFKAYELACKRGEVVPGRMFIFELTSLVNPKYIINFPTKRHWRGASRIEDIQDGLADLVEVVNERHIASLAVPPLGAGLGGLDWKLVKSKIEAALAPLADVDIEVFEPGGAPAADEVVRNKAVPNMTAGRAALVILAYRYLGGLLDPFVTLLELHKLIYFLQECGEPLRLRYVKAPHGPYAENLSHVLNAVEGHLLSGYADGGDEPDKQIRIIPGAQRDANAFLSRNSDTAERVNRVAELTSGYETPFGMELLATVHWAAKNEAETMLEIVRTVYAWGREKRKFSERQLNLAVERLVKQGWIPEPTGAAL